MLAGFRAANHPQQVETRGALDEVDDRGTDPSFVAEVEANLGARFTLDVAAAPHNAKAPKFYTRADDGLTQSWAGELVWCNPPYSGLDDWLAKAWQEYAGTNGIVMLLPANRCEQGWWQRHVEPHRDRTGSPLSVRFLPGRMRFERRDATIGPKGDRPPFGCVLLTWADPRERILTIGHELTIYHRLDVAAPYEVECTAHGHVCSKGSRSAARNYGIQHIEKDHEAK